MLNCMFIVSKNLRLVRIFFTLKEIDTDFFTSILRKYLCADVLH